MGQVSHLQRVEYAPGMRIFHEGDPANVAYIIEKGKVELTKSYQGDEVVFAVLGPGELLGEMALLEDKPRSATARVMEQTTLCVVPQAAMAKYLDQTPPMIRKMVNVLSDRLRGQTSEYCKRKGVFS